MGDLVELRRIDPGRAREETRRPDCAPQPKDDAELVERAINGDRSAEDELVSRYAREVARMISRLLGTQDEVEDIAQEVFLAAFEQLERLREPAVFRGWLLRIAVNQTRMVIRKRRLLRTFGLDRTTSDVTLKTIADEGLGPEARAELAAIDEVLRRLPTEHRIAWVLRHVEGHTVRDVSRLCNCSLATTKRRLAAAHAKVLESIDEEVLHRGC